MYIHKIIILQHSSITLIMNYFRTEYFPHPIIALSISLFVFITKFLTVTNIKKQGNGIPKCRIFWNNIYLC